MYWVVAVMQLNAAELTFEMQTNLFLKDEPFSINVFHFIT